MLRIRKVADATTAVNRSAIEAAQKIMREQFPAMPDYDIDKLPEQLANPLKHRFVSRLFVAENARDQTLGLALLLHAPDIGFSYLELVSTAPGRMGEGIGATLYERVREEARALGTQLYFESLPDDPALSPNPEIRANNANRLKFYERYGARPIINTAYETPVTPGTVDPPYLMLDPLGANDLPSRDKVKKVVRAILERKYGLLGGVRPDGGGFDQGRSHPLARAALRQIEASAEGRSARRHRSRASRWCSTTTIPSIMCRSAAMSRRRCASARSWPSSTLGSVREDAGQALLRPAYPRRA